MAERWCDIIVPVYNGLNHVRACLDSLLQNTRYPHRIIIIDDRSDDYVRSQLALYERRAPSAIKVLYNEENLGFVKTVNRAIAYSSAPYVVLLNSDTIVPEGWLTRMVECAESQPEIGIVNPISNMAVNLSVPMAPGLDVFTMDRVVQQVSRRSFPDVVTAVGFCFLIKRELIERFGGFDEVYGRGYCEESDYCMRAVSHGYRVVAADHVFVYHRGCGSFGQWHERYLKNRKIFDSRWAELYNRLLSRFEKEDPLGYLRQRLVEHTRAPRFDVTAIKELLEAGKNLLDREGVKGLITRLPLGISRFAGAVADMAKTAVTARKPMRPEPVSQRLYATAEYIKRLPPRRGLGVAFLLYRFDISGGVISTLQIANELIRAGERVYLITMSDEPAAGSMTLYTRPIRYRTLTEMAEAFPDVDVVVATFWPTAYYWLPEILKRRSGLRAVYFVQDYEPWFYREGNRRLRQRVVESYGMAHYRIVKTDWLKAMLEGDGYSAEKIHLGLNLDVFYPAGFKDYRGKKRILFQARPFDRVRGFVRGLELFERLWKRRQDIEVVFFGCRQEDLAKYRIGFAHRNMGIIYDENRVAGLYRQSHLLVDCSDFHGFGRPGLEAMACGVPAVLTPEGGVGEYAIDGYNALLVPPQDVDAMVEAIEQVLDDEPLRQRLIEGGLSTAKGFCHRDEARLHRGFYRAIAGLNGGCAEEEQQG